METKLKKGDTFIINEESYYGIKKGKYIITNIGKDRKGNLIYKFKNDRKNAVKIYYLYVSDVDGDLKIPTKEDILTNIGLTFLNFKSIIKYDEVMIEECYKERYKELAGKYINIGKEFLINECGSFVNKKTGISIDEDSFDKKLRKNLKKYILEDSSISNVWWKKEEQEYVLWIEFK